MNDNLAGTNKLSLIIGLAIPVLMVIFIAVSINAPRWFNSVEPPAVDFLYLAGRENPYAQFVIRDGRLVQLESVEPEKHSPPGSYKVHFIVHDVSENRSREVRREEAERLALDSSLQSPDGFTVEPGRRSGWFIFDFRPDYNSRYLVKDTYSEKIKIVKDSGRNYYYGFRFLGWIETQ